MFAFRSQDDDPVTMPPLPDQAFPCGKACAGFPSPAEDHLDAPLDLRALMMPEPLSSFVRACEAPWACGGDGWLVFRKSGTPFPGCVVSAESDGRPVTARVAGTRASPYLVDGAGRRIRGAEARVRGVAAWAARRHAGERQIRSGGLDGLVGDAAATYLFRVTGWSMRDAGIHDGDILVVDRSRTPAHGNVVIAVAGGARSVKRLVVEEGRARLSFENADFPPYAAPASGDVHVFGVVTWAIRRLAGGGAR